MISLIYVVNDAVHPPDFVFETNADQDYWLMLLTHTPALFLVDGGMKKYPANCVVIFPPKHKILYRACTDSYSNDWLRFYSDVNFAEQNLLPIGVPFFVPDSYYIHSIFQLLAYENFFQNNLKELNIYHLFQLILNKLSQTGKNPNPSPYYHALIDLRTKIYTNPRYNWTISTISNDLNISNSYTNKIYKNTFGVSCIEDVIQARITLAKEQLLRSSLSISEIANLCGYNNVEHFHRQFRKITGYTPLDFRNSGN